MWQDIVITICLILFSYALLPQIYQGFKKRKALINLQTSLLTTLGMYVLTITYFTLELTFSTAIAFITGTLWAILLFQGIFYK